MRSATPTTNHTAEKQAGSAGTASPPQPRRKTSPSEARAAERSQLAGAIRTASAPFRKPAERIIVPAEDAEPIPAKAFSGRLLALAVVLVTITVLLAPSVRTYLQQQAETEALQERIAALQREQDTLETQIARWEDPAYIKQQARDRLFLVMPGETRYLVKGGTAVESSEEQQSAASPADLPWADALWASVERAATD
ncbi:FtsB family cell division protein [Arthrobacter subterraneus]|uniref:FtsB family cell division protein n=1 Tax=Arthrobacter subterraneus TaxID=335973 RepID=UPI003806A314